MRKLWCFAAMLGGGLCLVVASAQAGAPPTPEQKAFEDQVKQKAPKPAVPGKAYNFSDGVIDGQLGTAKMRRANTAAATLVRERMARDRSADLAMLSKAARADVIVISGQYDRVQDVLTAMSIEHVVLPPDLVPDLDLMVTQTLMVNCHPSVAAGTVPKLREFVQRGGYLVTTDWALKHLTQRAFPKTIEHNGVQTRNDVVPVHVHDPSHPLLKDLKLTSDSPQWWLEGASYPIKVLDPRKVAVLMSSPAMAKRYQDAPVVVAFEHGEGRVVHMTSHFYLQQSKAIAAAGGQEKRPQGSKSALTQAEIDALNAKGIDASTVNASDLNSAFAMQQLIANMLLLKQKANTALLAKYGSKTKLQVSLSGDAARKADNGATQVGKEFRVKVLRREGDRVEVEDLFGRKGWVDANALY